MVEINDFPIYLQLSSDGFKIEFKRKSSVWATFLTLLNFNKFERRNVENVLLLSVEVVKTGQNPHIEEMLFLLVKELKTLQKGIAMREEIRGKKILKAFLHSTCSDLQVFFLFFSRNKKEKFLIVFYFFF